MQFNFDAYLISVPTPEEDSTTDEEGRKPHKRKKTDGHKIPTKVIICC